jgi:hypothetical protein
MAEVPHTLLQNRNERVSINIVGVVGYWWVKVCIETWYLIFSAGTLHCCGGN